MVSLKSSEFYQKLISFQHEEKKNQFCIFIRYDLLEYNFCVYFGSNLCGFTLFPKSNSTSTHFFLEFFKVLPLHRLYYYQTCDYLLMNISFKTNFFRKYLKYLAKLLNALKIEFALILMANLCFICSRESPTQSFVSNLSFWFVELY